MKECVPVSEINEIVSKVKTWNPLRAEKQEPFDYIDLSSIDQQKKVIVSTSKISPKEAPSRARQLVQKGDILISTVRPNLNGVAYVPEQLDGATASTGFCVLRPMQKTLYGSYLFHWVQTSHFVNEMVKLATGANYPAVSDRIVKASRIPLPPFEEQKRIAGILDKAAAIRRKREKAIVLADDFLKSVYLDMFGDPITNPKGWVTEKIHPLIDSIETGLNINGENRLREQDEFGVLKISAVTSGIFIPNEHKVVLVENVRRKVSPRKGDLLFSRANTRELVAATCIVEKDEPNLFLPDKLWRINTKESKLKKEYLKYLFTHKQFRMELTKQATGTSGSMLNISQKKLLDLNIPLPPIELQKKFSAIFWRYSETINKLNELKKNSEHLFLSLSQRAFRGDL